MNKTEAKKIAWQIVAQEIGDLVEENEIDELDLSQFSDDQNDQEMIADALEEIAEELNKKAFYKDES